MLGPTGSTSPDTSADDRLRPVARSRRIVTLDILRGLSILLIPMGNVYHFAMPFSTYHDPTLAPNAGPLDVVTWALIHLFFDNKFLPIFSMLYGAGIILMAESARAKGRPLTGLYCRRQFWLLVIGLAHLTFLWFGDVLTHYAVIGLVVYLFRNRSAKFLVPFGVAVYLVGLPLSTMTGQHLDSIRQEAIRIQASEDGSATSPEEQAILDEWASARPFLYPTREEIDEEIATYRSGYATIFRERVPESLFLIGIALIGSGLWQSGGLMLIGMGLMKLGVFSGRLSFRFYCILAAVGCGVGFPLVAAGVADQVLHGFDPIRLHKIGSYFNYVAGVPVALGYVGATILLWQLGKAPRLNARLAAAGRMALTNYLTQSILMSLVFYGYGLGLYGSVNRLGQVSVALGVFLVQLAWSEAWLRRFRYGPIEWVWRSLAYWRLQPLVRSAPRTPERAIGE